MENRKAFSGLEVKATEFRVEVKATKWAFDRIKEAFEQAAQDEAGRLSIVHEIMIRSNITCEHRASGEPRRRYDVILVPAL